MSWLGDRISDVVHAVVNVKNDIAKQSFLHKAAFVALGPESLVTSVAISKLSDSKIGKSVVGGADSITAGTASRLLAPTKFEASIVQGQAYSNQAAFSAGKQYAIGAATVGAAVVTGGAAAGAVGGLGAGATLATGAGVVAGLKTGSLVGNALASGNPSQELSAAVGVIGAATGVDAGDATGAVGDVLGLFGGGGGSAPARSAGNPVFINDPTGLSSGINGPRLPTTPSSATALALTALAVYAYYRYSRRHA